jgi:DNA polymerase IV
VRWQRCILHVDLDAFFAAVEQRDNPALRGKPVLIGGSARRGVVAACSYEARRFGIHSAMPMAEAMRRCPQAIVVAHRMERYAEASTAFFAILHDYSPSVEGLSFDEAFVDLTGTERLLGQSIAVARIIKQRVVDELQLVVSAGIAPNKFAAKIASDIDKPNGLRVVEPEQLLQFLHPLPLSRLWGVGEVTAQALTSLGLSTIGDVARYPAAGLVSRLGASMGHHLAALARGQDGRPVVGDTPSSSVGHQETFNDDIDDKQDLVATLLHQADRVAARLRNERLQATVVVLIIKYDDFRQITRRIKVSATSDGSRIFAAVLGLLHNVQVSDDKGARVRLCGISTNGLVCRDAPKQLSFDQADTERGERLGATLDKLTSKFGDHAVSRAVHLPTPKKR